jgi:hypothetical protein
MCLTRRMRSWKIPMSLLTAGLLGIGACAAEVGDDPVTTTTAAFTTAECAFEDRDVQVWDAVFGGPGTVPGGGPSGLPVITPTTYSNRHCWRGFVVLGDILVSDTTLQTGGGPTARVTVRWNDALPTNRTDCDNTFMSGLVYDYVWPSGSPWYNLVNVGPQQFSSGVWVSRWPLPSRCVISPMVFDSATYLQHLQPGLEQDGPGNAYRFAITGRAPNGQTRSVRLDYDPPQVIN